MQRGLNSLGFLHGEITGVADQATAKAIRNFEVYFNYAETGRLTRAAGQPACCRTAAVICVS